MRHIFMGVALLLLAGTAVAQTGTVYRCKDASGHQSLQSHPCGPGQTVEAAQQYRAKRLTKAEEDAIRRRNLRPVERAQAPQRGGTAAMIRPRANNACANARATRDRMYRDNMKLGHDARRRLGDMVRNACK